MKSINRKREEGTVMVEAIIMIPVVNFSEEKLEKEFGEDLLPKKLETLMNYINRLEYELGGWHETTEISKLISYLSYFLKDGKIFDTGKTQDSISNAIYLRAVYNYLKESNPLLEEIFKILLEQYDPNEVYSDIRKRRMIQTDYVEEVSDAVLSQLNSKTIH